MSNHFTILTTAMRLAYRDINSTDKMVLVTLLNHYNYKTMECRPSALCIANECSASERTVHRSLVKLREQGYINYIRGHTGKANVYTFEWGKVIPSGLAGLYEPMDNMTEVQEDSEPEPTVIVSQPESIPEPIPEPEPTVKVSIQAKGKGKGKQKVKAEEDIVDVEQGTDGSWSSEAIGDYLEDMLKETELPF